MKKKFFSTFIFWAILLVFTLIFFNFCGRKSDTFSIIRKDVQQIIYASGNLDIDKMYFLTAKSEGQLIELNFNEGDELHKNQVVGTIHNSTNTINALSSKKLLQIAEKDTSLNAPLLLQIETQIHLAEEKLKQEEIQFKRFEKLYLNGNISKSEMENAELNFKNATSNLQALKYSYAANAKLAKQAYISTETQNKISQIYEEDNLIRVASEGKVYKKLKRQGDYVKKGEIIAEIGNKKTFYAKLSIDETNIKKIQIGQMVYIELNTHNTKKYKAIIDEILPTFDVGSQSFYCKARFQEPLDFEIFNTQLQANIFIEEKKNVLVIPKKFLYPENKVYINQQETKTIEVGIVSNEWVEVISGLSEGEKIISFKK